MASRDLGGTGYYEGEEKPAVEKAGELAQDFLLEEEKKTRRKILFGAGLILVLVILYLISSGAIKID